MTQPTESESRLIDEAIAAHLFGESSPEQRRRMEIAVERSPEVRARWEEMSAFLEALGSHPLPEAASDFEDDMIARLRRTARTPSAATVAMVHGDVRRRPRGAKTWSPVISGDALAEGDAIEVGAGGRALVRLPDRSELWVNAGSLLRLISRTRERVVRLVRGELLAFMEKQRRAFRVLTTDGAVEVVGTVFGARSRPGEGTRVSVLEGRVRVTSGRHRREVGTRRRVDIRRRQSMTRTARLSGAEVRRLSGWAAPMRTATRAAESRALPAPQSRRGLWLAIGTVGVMAAVGLLYVAGQWRGREQSAPASALPSQTQRIELADPVQLSFAPSPGGTWRQTTYLHGSVVDGTRHTLEIHLTSQARVRPAETPGHVTVTHSVERAAVQGAEAPLPADLRAAVEEALADATLVETLDPQGRRVGLLAQAGMDDGSHSLIVGPALLTLLGTATGTAEGPLQAGASWLHRHPTPLASEPSLVTTSSLSHFETLDGDPLAVIRSATVARHSEMTPDAAAPVITSDLRWIEEARHRIEGGRRIFAIGEISLSSPSRDVRLQYVSQTVPADWPAPLRGRPPGWRR